MNLQEIMDCNEKLDELLMDKNSPGQGFQRRLEAIARFKQMGLISVEEATVARDDAFAKLTGYLAPHVWLSATWINQFQLALLGRHGLLDTQLSPPAPTEPAPTPIESDTKLAV